ncbi:MAG: hypothetical protein ACPGYJ_11460, partial [bacterium]
IWPKSPETGKERLSAASGAQDRNSATAEEGEEPNAKRARTEEVAKATTAKGRLGTSIAEFFDFWCGPTRDGGI